MPNAHALIYHQTQLDSKWLSSSNLSDGAWLPLDSCHLPLTASESAQDPRFDCLFLSRS